MMDVLQRGAQGILPWALLYYCQ